MRTILAAIVICGLAAVAANPPGYEHWTAASLRAYSKKLVPKMDPKLKLSVEQLGKFGNHSFMVAHREADGEAELHDTQADVFVVQSGEANFVVGGTVQNPKTTEPGEVRGTSIQGGQRTRLGAGDIVHIPAKVAHQVLVEPGKQFTYFIVKIDTP